MSKKLLGSVGKISSLFGAGGGSFKGLLNNKNGIKDKLTAGSIGDFGSIGLGGGPSFDALPINVKDVVQAENLEFFTKNTDKSKSAPIKVVLDDMDAVQKNNSMLSDVGGGGFLSNFSAGGVNYGSIANGFIGGLMSGDQDFASGNFLSAFESSSTENVSNTVGDAGTRKNPLFNYEPVNYVITLSAIGKGMFNGGVKGDGTVIFKSGGKTSQGTGALGVDYYVDNLVLRNTVAPMAEAGTSQIYQILFTVTEPYGTSFIDALIQAAKAEGWENHLAACYKLKIEFKGIDDAGNPTVSIPKTTREIPIAIYSVDTNIDAGATTYTVSAAPTAYFGLNDVHVITSESITVTGDTVGAVIKDFMTKYTQVQQQKAEQGKVLLGDEYELDVKSSDATLETPIGYTLSSDASNVFQIANVGPAGGGGGRELTVPRGTNIQNFIETVIRESDKYAQQFEKDGSAKTDGEGFMSYNRVFTQCEILNENNGNGRPQFKFKFIVRPYKVTSGYFQKTGQDVVSNVLPSRTYNYIYTGKNQDVLDFDINYNFAFYQAVSYNQPEGNKPKTDASTGEQNDQDKNNNEAGTETGSKTARTKEFTRMPDGSFVPSANSSNQEYANVFQQVIENPLADLIAVNMTILGDPYWIEQKTVSNKSFQGSLPGAGSNIAEDGSVAVDDHEIYIKLNFKTPADLDDTKGLFKLQNANFFQGIYKVYMCESRFEGGMFTQVLSMVRMAYQNADIIDDQSYEVPLPIMSIEFNDDPEPTVNTDVQQQIKKGKNNHTNFEDKTSSNVKKVKEIGVKEIKPVNLVKKTDKKITVKSFNNEQLKKNNKQKVMRLRGFDPTRR